ncbi:MAG: hypothetical protein ACI3XR_01595 [Eubacteriales bacterium]
MLVLLFTVINCALLIGGSTTYFLFSAYIPYIFVGSAMMMTGHMSDEFYGDEKPTEFFPDSFLYVAIAVAAVILICYLVCWIVIKKHGFAGCLCALILFGIDSALLLLDIVMGMSFDLSAAVDILFHAWVLYYLIVGLSASAKLKKLPPEPELSQYSSNPEFGENPDFAADYQDYSNDQNLSDTLNSDDGGQIPPAESADDGESSDENQ